MPNIDKQYFFDNYPFKSTLNGLKLEKLEFLINKFDGSELFTRLSYFACALGNIRVETNDTFKPVVEGYYLPESKRAGALYNYYAKNNPGALKSIFPNGRNGKAYYGRGYIQATHKWNYEKFNPLIKKRFPNIDIVNDPDKACDPEIAWIILEEGMTNPNHTFRDANFTGFTLEQFFNDKVFDWVGSRKIINGRDRANEIAMYGRAYYKALRFENEQEEVTPGLQILANEETASDEAEGGIEIDENGGAHKAIRLSLS